MVQADPAVPKCECSFWQYTNVNAHLKSGGLFLRADIGENGRHETKILHPHIAGNHGLRRRGSC